MTALPAGVRAYKQTPVFDQDTVPAALCRDHQTKDGVWGRIVVLSGRLRYVVPSTATVETLSPERCGIVEPAMPHHVEPLGEVQFFVEFLRA